MLTSWMHPTTQLLSYRKRYWSWKSKHYISSFDYLTCRHKEITHTHIIVKLIHSSLHSESKINISFVILIKILILILFRYNLRNISCEIMKAPFKCPPIFEICIRLTIIIIYYIQYYNVCHRYKSSSSIYNY